MVLAFLCFTIATHALPGSQFNFRNITLMKTGASFEILLRNKEGNLQTIGSGRILRLSAKVMAAEFQLKRKGLRVKGSMRIRHLLRKGKNDFLRIRYKIQGSISKISGIERVRADAIFADKGLLTFRYRRGKSYFQLARDSRGREKVATEHGVVLLRLR